MFPVCSAIFKKKKRKQDNHLNRQRKALDKNTQKLGMEETFLDPMKHQQNKTHLKSYLVVKDQMLSL